LFQYGIPKIGMSNPGPNRRDLKKKKQIEVSIARNCPGA
jgi:hypothetical protein